MAGRKKLSNQDKVLRGTNQPCRMSSEVGLTKIETTPRSGLKGTAKKIFELTASELVNKGLMEVVNLDLVIAYSREMGLYHDKMRELEKVGYTITVTTKFGKTEMVNPNRKVAESALSNAKAIAVEFGFTPASRHRISTLVEPSEIKDEFAQFEEIRDE